MNNREERRKAREERKALVEKFYGFAKPFVEENLVSCAAFAHCIGTCIKSNNYDQWVQNAEKMLAFADAIEQRYGKIQFQNINFSAEQVKVQINRMWVWNNIYSKVEKNLSDSGVSMETFCGMDGELRLKFREEFELYAQFRDSMRGI